ADGLRRALRIEAALARAMDDRAHAREPHDARLRDRPAGHLAHALGRELLRVTQAHDDDALEAPAGRIEHDDLAVLAGEVLGLQELAQRAARRPVHRLRGAGEPGCAFEHADHEGVGVHAFRCAAADEDLHVGPSRKGESRRGEMARSGPAMRKIATGGAGVKGPRVSTATAGSFPSMEAKDAVPRTLVTGGNGNLGQAVARLLLDSGYETHVTVR